MNQNLKVENFKECYIRDFSSVIRNQKNEVANWKNNRKKKAGIDENENEEEKKTNEGAATDNYKIEEAEVPNATSINYSKKIKEKKRETFQTYLSIKELKNQMNEYIKNYYEQKNHEKLTFYNIMKTIHEKLSSAQRSIVNIQICFLSLLHLSAEQSFTLKPTPLDPNNFFIFLKENL